MKSASPVRPEARLSSFFASVVPPFGSVFGFRSRTSTSRFFFSADSGWLFSLGIIYISARGRREYQGAYNQSTRKLSFRHDEAGNVITTTRKLRAAPPVLASRLGGFKNHLASRPCLF